MSDDGRTTQAEAAPGSPALRLRAGPTGTRTLLSWAKRPLGIRTPRRQDPGRGHLGGGTPGRPETWAPRPWARGPPGVGPLSPAAGRRGPATLGSAAAKRGVIFLRAGSRRGGSARRQHSHPLVQPGDAARSGTAARSPACGGEAGPRVRASRPAERKGERERAGRGREGTAGALTGHVGEQRDAQQQLHPPAADGGREAQERLAQHPGPRAAAAGLLERLRRGRPEGPAPRPLPAGGARAHAPRSPRPAPQAQCGGPGGRRVRVRGPKRYSWAAVGGVLQTPIRALGADSGMGRCLEFFTASL